MIVLLINLIFFLYKQPLIQIDVTILQFKFGTDLLESFILLLMVVFKIKYISVSYIFTKHPKNKISFKTSFASSCLNHGSKSV